MNAIRIRGGIPLSGTVRISGAKNAALPVMAATLLTEEKCRINQVPALGDVMVMGHVLELLGARVTHNGESMLIDNRDVQPRKVLSPLMRQLRASCLSLGPLLGRFGWACISYPGGCDIGPRPIDLHLKGLAAMGAEISQEGGYISARARELVGANIHLDFPSVGATENLMMAASLAKGTTLIHNAAKEPEIVDLQNYLNSMGAQISGAGLHTIKIEGVEKLSGAEHEIIPDRIEAGTYLIAGAITGGTLRVENVVPEHLSALIAKLGEAGAILAIGPDYIEIVGPARPRAVDVKTLPYPGFPTDLQPQIMALLSLAEGTSTITESIFLSRFKHVDELRRMGAQIVTEGQSAIVRGVKKLVGATVTTTDLRAGAGLLLAGLAAEGVTVLEQIQHLDRGYSDIESKLKSLGAEIERLATN